MYSNQKSLRKKRHRLLRQRGGGWFSKTFSQVSNPFAGFFTGFRRMFTSKPKHKQVNPFEGIPNDVDPTTGRKRVHKIKSMERFNSDKNNPVVMHITAHPTQISPTRHMPMFKSKSMTKSVSNSKPKSNGSRRNVKV